MRLQNGRLYQFLFDKCKCASLAVAGTLAVRSCVRLGLRARACLPARGFVPGAPEARARLQALFPKPGGERPEARGREDSDIDLSIIVPVYNTGDMLAPCVESVYAQVTSYRWELLLIDDGSGPDTAARLTQYEGRPDTVVTRQPNMGAAAARNRGLDMARGEYVMFLDADDLLLPGAVENLLRAAHVQRADFVQGGWKYTDGPSQRFPDKLYEGDARMDLIELPGMPWGKVIKRSLFSRLRFPTAFTSYVDSPIKCLVLRMAVRAATVSPLVYAWRRNPGGITFTSKKTPRALQTYWITEQMRDDSLALGLPSDALTRAIWIRQMTCVAYDRLKGLDEAVQRDVFALACDFLAPELAQARRDRLPFALSLACRAFEKRDFALWQQIGRFYTLTL